MTLVYFTRLENPSELGQTPTEKEDKTEMDELHPPPSVHIHIAHRRLLSVLYRCINNIQTAFTPALSDQNLCFCS